MSSRPARPVITLALMGGILAVSTASIFIRFAQEYASSLVIAALRLVFASLLLAPLALSKHQAELFSLKKQDGVLALVSGIFLAFHFATWISSLEYTTVASSVVLVTTTPLWVALLSPLVLKEPISRPVIWGMLLALLGGLVIGFSEVCRWNNGVICPSAGGFLQGQAVWGNFLALVGAWMAAGYLLIGRSLRARMTLIPYIFVVYGMAAVVLLILVFASGQSVLYHPPQAYFWILLLAIFPQLLGHSTFNWALKYLPASLVSITLLGEPIGSTILALIILDEVPSLPELLGAAFILVGIYLASRPASSKDLEEAVVINE
jgi:drug/metabolite transporter (DMT)-like permease